MERVPRHVLVVDDDVDAAESMAALLELDGHRIEMTHSGLEVLAIARRIVPDLIVMDIGLPGLDGYEVARLVRQERLLDRTLLVAVTGWGRDDDKRAAVEAGFDIFLVKPVGLDPLREVLARLG